MASINSINVSLLAHINAERPLITDAHRRRRRQRQRQRRRRQLFNGERITKRGGADSFIGCHNGSFVFRFQSRQHPGGRVASPSEIPCIQCTAAHTKATPHPSVCMPERDIRPSECYTSHPHIQWLSRGGPFGGTEPSPLN